MQLSDVAHQDTARRRLRDALAACRVPHAYLFAGPDGVGKRMLAVRFAQRLLCANPAQDACGACEECAMMASGVHPDYHYVDRGLKKFHRDKRVQARAAIKLSIDVIRQFVIEAVLLRPVRGRAKVFVIDEAERMSPDAQNALLKTLEEPPPDTYLILCTRSPEQVLPTTRSRCQVVPFGPLPSEFIIERLTNEHGIDAADARLIAELAGGQLSVAVQYAEREVAARAVELLRLLTGVFDDPIAFGKGVRELAEAIAKRAKEAARAETDDVEDDVEGDADEDGGHEISASDTARTSRRIVLSLVGGLLRDVLRVACGDGPRAVSRPADVAVVETLARRLGRRGVVRALRAVSDAEAALEQNANVGLVFDALGLATSGPAPVAVAR
ncbi:MAG: DNA polymerase III subunit delta' [Phycisphaerae bacterium]|nr:DNA polymerase III subunit delta' [Phycisphaerae bacterium]